MRVVRHLQSLSPAYRQGFRYMQGRVSSESNDEQSVITKVEYRRTPTESVIVHPFPFVAYSPATIRAFDPQGLVRRRYHFRSPFVKTSAISVPTRYLT